MIKRTVSLLLLAALVLPTAAAAENTELGGPLLVKGRGALKGEVEMANPAATRPLVFGGQSHGGRGGLVRFVDLAGDLRVDGGCRAVRGDGEAEARTAFVCRVRAGRVRAHGSRFRIAARLRTYAMAIPRGATARLRGHYVVVESDGQRERERPERERPKQERPEQERPKQERPKQERTDPEQPSRG
jgi:hypothetical protein